MFFVVCVRLWLRGFTHTRKSLIFLGNWRKLKWEKRKGAASHVRRSSCSVFFALRPRRRISCTITDPVLCARTRGHTRTWHMTHTWPQHVSKWEERPDDTCHRWLRAARSALLVGEKHPLLSLWAAAVRARLQSRSPTSHHHHDCHPHPVRMAESTVRVHGDPHGAC